MFSRIGPAALKNNLNNTIRICDFLSNPEKKIKTIHIAGTNGKGSVSHMLASVFQFAGYKTGLYTSPHLVNFRERIRINGEMISEHSVEKFTQRIMPLIEEIQPSFFEVTVGMAFDYFVEEHVDIAIIETGLGGRLDSTNVILPELSIITNIGYDHTQILGNTLEEIAAEKAGIIKAAIPIVIGRTQPETKNIFESRAREMGSVIYFSDKQYTSTASHLSAALISVHLRNMQTGEELDIESDMSGLYQKENIATVLTSINVLKQAGWNLPSAAIRDGIGHTKQTTGLLGRWDVLSLNPLLISDVAHNIDGIKEILKQLHTIKYEKLHFVLGFSKDKDIEALLELLPKDASYYFTQAHIPRALAHDELKAIGKSIGIEGKSFDDVNLAIEEALLSAGPNDLILVCGSIFVVGEIRKIINT
jgi:dihydrofolate synthase/folylpolyglutamate synthase